MKNVMSLFAMTFSLATASTFAQEAKPEVLGADKQIFFPEYGQCVAAPILKGAPEVVGKWRVKYKVQTFQSSGHWFVSWLNSERAKYGLSAVGYDANLEAWGAQNNAQQAARGIGHYVMGPARRQNSAMGSASQIGLMWMNSPGHRSALLDPTIRFIGLACHGQWFTFNAY